MHGLPMTISNRKARIGLHKGTSTLRLPAQRLPHGRNMTQTRGHPCSSVFPIARSPFHCMHLAPLPSCCPFPAPSGTTAVREPPPVTRANPPGEDDEDEWPRCERRPRTRTRCGGADDGPSVDRRPWRAGGTGVGSWRRCREEMDGRARNGEGQ